MKFKSTRGESPPINVSQAMSQGLAPDGGLYVPEFFPSFTIQDFDDAETIPQIAASLLCPFFDSDPLKPELAEICREAFNFPIPLTKLESGLSILEVFHGPTAAFKDVGARFLAECLSRINIEAERPLTILVATSGDTGGAVAAAFHNKPAVEVIVLYPHGKVSNRQQRQLTCWDNNIHTYAVNGVFDDCQQMVKAAFGDTRWQTEKRLSSANSINIGRLLPQMVYYAAASLWHYRRSGRVANFIIPTGNAGNVSACVWAKACGLPINKITMATNDNRPLPDFLQTGKFQPRPTIATIANAMDVGNPSNLERLRYLYQDISSFRNELSAVSIDEESIRFEIQKAYERWGIEICPHTACGFSALRYEKDTNDTILVATAHPAKFETVVEPLLKKSIVVPQLLERLLTLPSQYQQVNAGIQALTRQVLRS